MEALNTLSKLMDDSEEIFVSSESGDENFIHYMNYLMREKIEKFINNGKHKTSYEKEIQKELKLKKYSEEKSNKVIIKIRQFIIYHEIVSNNSTNFNKLSKTHTYLNCFNVKDSKINIFLKKINLPILTQETLKIINKVISSNKKVNEAIPPKSKKKGSKNKK